MSETTDYNIFDLDKFMSEVHQVARDKGWWDAPVKTDLEYHMLMVAEIAEASEDVRCGSPALYLLDGEGVVEDKPCGEASELADCILRILDYAKGKNLPLIEALLKKNEYNKTRPYKHGKLK